MVRRFATLGTARRAGTFYAAEVSLTGEAVDELYSLAPDGFLERRKELVTAARAAKDRDAAKTIATMRRPTVAAWLINMLRRDPEGGASLTDLAALGARLREAQAALAADLLRELGRERRTRVADLVSRAEELSDAAGHTIGPAVEREIEETLVAAVADEAAAEAVLSGALTRALSYSGFGEVDLDAAVAALPPAPVAKPRATESGPPEPDAEHEARVQQAAAALDAAKAALAAAHEEARQASERRDAAEAAASASNLAVADLQRRLAAAQDAAAAAALDQQQAEEDARERERREQAAADYVERRREELARLAALHTVDSTTQGPGSI